jgi:hypothetical protein
MCEKNIQFYRDVIDRLLPENLKEDMPLGDGVEEYKTNSDPIDTINENYAQRE